MRTSIRVTGAMMVALLGGTAIHGCGAIERGTPGGGGSGESGTGGWVCFAAGTPVATPRGPVPIESLRPGDLVWAFDVRERRVVPRPVVATMAHPEHPVGELHLEDGGVLRVTPNHPFFLPERGEYQAIGDLAPHTALLRLRGDQELPTTAPTSGRERFDFDPRSDLVTVYNITVAEHENYFAGGILVHNKSLPTGGDGTCFAAGTPVATPNGPIAIERLRKGDRVWAFDSMARRCAAREVTAVMVHHEQRVGRLRLTDGQELRVTSNHPFFVPERGSYVPVGDIGAHTALLRLSNGEASPTARVESFEIDEAAPLVTVYNITVAEHENYFAGDILVHNKSPHGCEGEFWQGDCDARPCLEEPGLGEGGMGGQGGLGGGLGGGQGGGLGGQAPHGGGSEDNTVLEATLCDPMASEEELHIAFDAAPETRGARIFYGAECSGGAWAEMYLASASEAGVQTYCFTLPRDEQRDFVAIVGDGELANLRRVDGCPCDGRVNLVICAGVSNDASCEIER